MVVVEPTDESIDTDEVEHRVRHALEDLPYTLRLGVKVSGPVNPKMLVSILGGHTRSLCDHQ